MFRCVRNTGISRSTAYGSNRHADDAGRCAFASGPSHRLSEHHEQRMHRRGAQRHPRQPPQHHSQPNTNGHPVDTTRSRAQADQPTPTPKTTAPKADPDSTTVSRTPTATPSTPPDQEPKLTSRLRQVATTTTRCPAAPRCCARSHAYTRRSRCGSGPSRLRTTRSVGVPRRRPYGRRSRRHDPCRDCREREAHMHPLPALWTCFGPGPPKRTGAMFRQINSFRSSPPSR